MDNGNFSNQVIQWVLSHTPFIWAHTRNGDRRGSLKLTRIFEQSIVGVATGLLVSGILAMIVVWKHDGINDEKLSGIEKLLTARIEQAKSERKSMAEKLDSIGTNVGDMKSDLNAVVSRINALEQDERDRKFNHPHN